MEPREISEVLNRPFSQELLARDVTRLAYIARDETPRSIPIAFTSNGSEIVMCTTKHAALRYNPAVALTIHTGVRRPRSCRSAGGPSWMWSTGSLTSTSR